MVQEGTRLKSLPQLFSASLVFLLVQVSVGTTVDLPSSENCTHVPDPLENQRQGPDILFPQK